MTDDTATPGAPDAGELLSLTTEIVSSHLSNNEVAVSEVPALIENVHDALTRLATGPAASEPERPRPVVPIKKSITPDYIVCLEDGKQLKMLKRYLRTRHNMTPDEYRARWGLPKDYPMMAPNYAKLRSDLAKKIGLGNRSRRLEQA